MEEFLQVIQSNTYKKECVTLFTKESEEQNRFDPKEYLWGAGIRVLSPARITTAWLLTQDPLMIVAGQGYRSTEVRDKSFTLMQEALTNLRGNRKLTKGKMSDALSSIKPTVDQTKVIAGILLALHRIQTICYDADAKTVWTVPEDIRAWSSSYATLWVDARCEQMLDWSSGTPNLGSWLADRDAEGWKFEWPVAEGSFEEIKSRAAALDVSPRALQPGVKIKKEDWAKALGKAEAIEHLLHL